ncbi:hypothetical protein NQ315_004597 [Exocentrus adspersus]|uniref:Reticulocyte binding protein n=1 Tax=Exocentrus adspersus TaxID=1586481 RepID=A0AAV8VPM9_9CUCU|nr:hypothetical protein NQ315_004597 [Exocentrus adspersus]
MNLKILCALFYVAIAARQTLNDDNVCYKGIKPRLEELIELYSNPPTSSKYPSDFPDINSLIERTDNYIKNIISDLIKVQLTFNETETIREVINDNLDEANQLREAINVLKLLEEEMKKLNEKKEGHDKSFTMCSEALKLFEQLKKNVDDVKKTGNELKAATDAILKRINDINDASIQINNNLDLINIPVSTFQQYVCDSSLQSTIQSSIDSLKNIAELLRQSFKEVIQQKIQQIENDINKNQEDINEINSLNTEIPTTNIKIDEKTNNTIQNLKEQIEDLKNKIDNMPMDETNDTFLDSIREKLKNLRNEYETILENVFSANNMNEVKKELELARQILRLLKEQDALKKELEDVKKIAGTLEKGGVCLKEKVNVEE